MRDFLLIPLFGLAILIFSCKEDDQIEEPKNVNAIEFLGETYSCGDFYINVLQGQGDTQRALLISGATREDLSLTNEIKTFSLPQENLNIEIRDYDIPINTSFFCNDIIYDPWPKQIGDWKIISGVLSLSVSDVQSINFSLNYNISVLLEDAIFENDNGEQLKVEVLKLDDLLVGWYAG